MQVIGYENTLIVNSTNSTEIKSFDSKFGNWAWVGGVKWHKISHIWLIISEILFLMTKIFLKPTSQLVLVILG